MAFSLDGSRLLTTSLNSARLWDGHSGELIGELSGHSGKLASSRFSADGTRIATADSAGAVRLWDGRTGEPMAVLIGHTGPVEDTAFAPDGRRLASASGDHTVRLWRAAPGDQSSTLAAHGGPVRTLAFDLDGDRVLTAVRRPQRPDLERAPRRHRDGPQRTPGRGPASALQQRRHARYHRLRPTGRPPLLPTR